MVAKFRLIVNFFGITLALCCNGLQQPEASRVADAESHTLQVDLEIYEQSDPQGFVVADFPVPVTGSNLNAERVAQVFLVEQEAAVILVGSFAVSGNPFKLPTLTFTRSPKSLYLRIEVGNHKVFVPLATDNTGEVYSYAAAAGAASTAAYLVAEEIFARSAELSGAIDIAALTALGHNMAAAAALGHAPLQQDIITTANDFAAANQKSVAELVGRGYQRNALLSAAISTVNALQKDGSLFTDQGRLWERAVASQIAPQDQEAASTLQKAAAVLLERPRSDFATSLLAGVLVHEADKQAPTPLSSAQRDAARQEATRQIANQPVSVTAVVSEISRNIPTVLAPDPPTTSTSTTTQPAGAIITTLPSATTTVLPTTNSTSTTTTTILAPETTSTTFPPPTTTTSLPLTTTTTTTTLPTADSTPPTPGTFLPATNITDDGFTLHWSAATDDTTLAHDLQYLVCSGDSLAAIDTANECSAATQVIGYTANILSFAVTGQGPEAISYFNVMVKDTAGNTAVYQGTTESTLPEVSDFAGNLWRDIAVGGRHACAVHVDGSLWCFGDNELGSLGDGTTENRLTPTRIGTAADWAAVETGSAHTCAIKAAGTLWCWGYNYGGQLGHGSTNSSVSPVQVGTDANWQRVAAGANHSCAIKTNGSLWCWGLDSDGQLGNGNASGTTQPTQVGSDSDWEEVAAGVNHTCAIKTSGSLWCWGMNSDYQLGLGTGFNRSSPEQVSNSLDWRSVALGFYHSCAIKSDNTLWC